jgi:hypothetical protein
LIIEAETRAVGTEGRYLAKSAKFAKVRIQSRCSHERPYLDSLLFCLAPFACFARDSSSSSKELKIVHSQPIPQQLAAELTQAFHQGALLPGIQIERVSGLLVALEDLFHAGAEVATNDDGVRFVIVDEAAHV